jgi:hypothetical protein
MRTQLVINSLFLTVISRLKAIDNESIREEMYEKIQVGGYY